MGPLKNPSSTQARSLQISSKTAIKLLLLTLVIAVVPLSLIQTGRIKFSQLNQRSQSRQL